MNMFMVFDFLMVGLGGYLFHAWYLLKYEKKVDENILLVKEYPLKRCKDQEAYMKYIAPRVLLFALICIVFGIVGVLNDYLDFLGPYYVILTFIFLAVVIWFAATVKKCYKKFW